MKKVTELSVVVLLWPLHLWAPTAYGQSTWELGKVAAYCRDNPNNANCAEVRRACREQYDSLVQNEKASCQALGWDPATFATRQLARAASRCSSTATAVDPTCQRFRAACREKRITCAQVKDIVCRPGENCDSRYLCTPASLKKACEESNRAGMRAQTVTARYTYVEDDTAAANTNHWLTVSSNLRGVFWAPLGLAVGADIELGTTLDGGFLYDGNIMLGVGIHTPWGLTLGLAGGGGLGAITGDRIPFAWRVPVEGFAVYDAGFVHALGYIRPAWLFKSELRKDGATFADEITVGLDLSVGPQFWEGRFVRRGGWTLSMQFREALGTRIYTVGLGFHQGDASR